MGFVEINHPNKCKSYFKLASTLPTSISNLLALTSLGLTLDSDGIERHVHRTHEASICRHREPNPHMAAAIIVKRIRGEAVGAAWPCDFRAADGWSRIRFYLSSGSLRQAQCDPYRKSCRRQRCNTSHRSPGRVGRQRDGWSGWTTSCVPAPKSPSSMSPLAGQKINRIIDQWDS